MYKPDNIQLSYKQARKCKRYRKEVIKFTKDKEENLIKVENDIRELTYKTGQYRYFKVYEPKERQIMALPFYDRVVQHAIVNVLEPIFNRRFITHSYACRKDKGMHAASNTLYKYLYDWRRYNNAELYAIKADIHAYFASINHDILKQRIESIIKDKKALELINVTIDNNGTLPDGVGIPVGNLTSQLFANVYLDMLDHYVKEELRAKYYVRYMDDFIILSPDKKQLQLWLAEIERYLNNELKLELNPKTTLICAKNGVDFVGYKHRATHRKLRPTSVKRIKKRIKEYEAGKIDKEKLIHSLESWKGHAKHADSYNLRKKIIERANTAISEREKGSNNDTSKLY